MHEERLRVWPPWPWPPWDPEDPDKPGKDKPTNRTKEAPKLAKQIIVLEKKIADASLDLVLYQDPIATYNPVPISNLTDNLPEIAWSNYFATFTPRNYPERAIITSTTYPTSLSSILQETDRETLEAYLETRAALALAPHLGTTTEAWRATRALEERLRGIKPGAVGDRAEYCVGRVETALGFAAGRYFVKEVFGGESREKGTKVISGRPSAHHVSTSFDVLHQISSMRSSDPWTASAGWTMKVQRRRLRKPMLFAPKLASLSHPIPAIRDPLPSTTI